MSGETLGTFPCDGCNGENLAVIRKRKNSRYLYTYCPECKTDQRSGKQRQLFLASIIKGESDAPEWKPTPETHKSPDDGQTRAREETQSSEQTITDNSGKKRTALGFAVGSLLTLATFAGAVAMKGAK